MPETVESPNGTHRAGFSLTGELLGTRIQTFQRTDGAEYVRHSAQILVGDSVEWIEFYDQDALDGWLAGVPERQVVTIPCRLRAFVRKNGEAAYAATALRPPRAG